MTTTLGALMESAYESNLITSAAMPTSLVTGGAGFLGAHVVRHCLDLGHKVVVLDDLSGGARGNVDPRAEFVAGGITNGALLAELFAKHQFDYVYHLAAFAAEGLSHYIRRFNYENNLVGGVNLINESVKNKVRCFVFTSSIAVYGSGETPFREDMPPRPEDPYGIAKLAVELDLLCCRRVFGVECVIFRPHNVYGELQSIGDGYRNVIGIFMGQIMRGEPLTIFGDGEQIRAFSYVGDVAPIIARSVHVPAAYGKVFNVGGDLRCSVNALAEAVMKTAGTRCAIRHLEPRHEVRHAYSDHAEARRVFGEAVPLPLEEGLRRMWAWAQTRGLSSAKRFAAIELRERLPPAWAET
jgi:UDP-glucose 4-epimerase